MRPSCTGSGGETFFFQTPVTSKPQPSTDTCEIEHEHKVVNSRILKEAHTSKCRPLKQRNSERLASVPIPMHGMRA
jgi:hypothetical protein